MLHNFLPSASDPSKCGILSGNRLCGHDEIAHSDKAECEFCDYIGVCTVTRANELACPTCRAAIELGTIGNPVQNATLQTAKDVDNRVQLKTDIFNAATESIVELRKVIEADPAIENKAYALAETLMGRFTHFKSVIFTANETIVDATNNQRAIQSYLNQMSNQLRAEEREKLKIADINYRPSPVKPVKTPKAISTTATAKKIDKNEIRKYAAQIGVPEFMLQMTVVSRGCSVPEGARILQATITAAKAQAANEVK